MNDMTNNQVPSDYERQVPVPAETSGVVANPGYGSYFPYGQTSPDHGTDFHAMAMRYVRIVVKYKWIILALIALSAALGVVTTLLKTPIYSAVTRIQIDRDATQVVQGGVTTPSETGSDFMRTQYELLRSRNLAERVVSAIQLVDDKSFFEPRNKSMTSFLLDFVRPSRDLNLPSASALEARAAAIVGSNISVRPVIGSRLVDLAYTDSSPERAQRIVNAYASAFIAANLDKRFEANAYARTFLDDQIKQLKIHMDDSESTLIEFAEKEKVIDVSKTSITEENLASANAALGSIIADRMRNEQSWAQVQNVSDLSLPQFVTNAVIDGLRAHRNQLVTGYEEKLATFKPSYPAMVQISNQIAEIDRQIKSEINTIKSTLKASYEASVAQERGMKQRIEELRTEVLDSQKKGTRYKMLKDEVDLNRSLYNSLLQRFKEVDVAGGVGTNNIFVVDRALTPGSPSEPNLQRTVMRYIVWGLAGGLGLALLLDKLHDRIYRPEEAEEFSGLPSLGIIPSVRDGQDFREQLYDLHSAVAEAYRSLATALQFSSSVGIPRSIAITSAGPSEGKSSTAFAIARHFAMSGKKVLLIDADMRKPSLHEFINQGNARGLSNYLVGSVEPPEVVQATRYPNLTFLPSGPLPPHAADLLSGTRMFSLVSAGSEIFDLIVIDTPPLLGLADAQLLASTASATLFVIAAGKQRKGLIRSSLRRLQLTRCNMIGTVLTNFDSRSMGYGYGYGYGYGDGGQSKPAKLAPDSDQTPGRLVDGQSTKSI